jgi:hypothetical protein
VERRLIPVNALIALCNSGDVYPAPLAAAGYQLSGVEVPVAAGDGKVVIDAVLFRADRNMLLAGEAKSGANVDMGQARRYDEVTPDATVLATAITIREPGDRQLQPVYVCLAENIDRVLLGLGEAGVAYPVLSVGDDHIEHHGADFVDPDLQGAFADPIPVPGPPPRIIAVDDESPDLEFDALVLPALVANLSHQRPYISVPALAEDALAHLPMYAKAARTRLVTRVDGAARRAADRDPATFEYLGRTATRDHAVVRFVRSPEDAARQGRTQVYQSIARAGGQPPRKRRAPDPDQMALFDDLIDELQTADAEPATDETTSDDEDGEERP